MFTDITVKVSGMRLDEGSDLRRNQGFYDVIGGASHERLGRVPPWALFQ
jgi:hypothetical protein